MANTVFSEKNKVHWLGVRPGVYGEQIIESGLASNGTTVLYTVPVGKILLLTYLSLGTSGDGAGDSYLAIYDAVPALVEKLMDNNMSTAHLTVSQAAGLYFPIEVSAGYSIRLVSTVAAVAARGTFAGLLVNPTENA